MASKDEGTPFEQMPQDKETIQNLALSENEMDLDTEMTKKKSTSGKVGVVKEEAFQELQKRYHQLLAISTKDRSEDEMKECNKLQRKYSKEKEKFPHLVEKRQAATGAERMEKYRKKQSGDDKEKVKAGDRDRKATEESKIATKERMAYLRLDHGTWKCHGGSWTMTRGKDGKRPQFPPPDVALHAQLNHKGFIYYPPDEEQLWWDREESKQFRRVR